MVFLLENIGYLLKWNLYQEHYNDDDDDDHHHHHHICDHGVVKEPDSLKLKIRHYF